MSVAIPVPIMTTKNCSRHCQMSSGEQGHIQLRNWYKTLKHSAKYLKRPLITSDGSIRWDLRLAHCSNSMGKAWLTEKLSECTKLQLKFANNPLQYSCLENSMDREVWQATIYGAAKGGTLLRLKHTHTHLYIFFNLHSSFSSHHSSVGSILICLTHFICLWVSLYNMYHFEYILLIKVNVSLQLLMRSSETSQFWTPKAFP